MVKINKISFLLILKRKAYITMQFKIYADVIYDNNFKNMSCKTENVFFAGFLYFI